MYVYSLCTDCVVKANSKYVQYVQIGIFKHAHCSWVNVN